MFHFDIRIHKLFFAYNGIKVDNKLAKFEKILFSSSDTLEFTFGEKIIGYYVYNFLLKTKIQFKNRNARDHRQMFYWTVNIYFISPASILFPSYGLLRRLLRYTPCEALGRGYRSRWASVTLSYELISRVQSSGTLSPYQFHSASPINWTGGSSIIVRNPLLDPFKKIHYSKILSLGLMRRVYFISHKPAHTHTHTHIHYVLMFSI